MLTYLPIVINVAWEMNSLRLFFLSANGTLGVIHTFYTWAFKIYSAD